MLRLESLSDCRLYIGSFPYFNYDASGGGGEFEVLNTSNNPNLSVKCNHSNFSIPSLDWRTTKFMGLPLPPGLSIQILPEILQGDINLLTGEVNLRFESSFCFLVFRLLHAPKLSIKTTLTTSRVESRRHQVQGVSLKEDGNSVLVGLAFVEPTGNFLLDRFLDLPNEALAILRCRITYTDQSV